MARHGSRLAVTTFAVWALLMAGSLGACDREAREFTEGPESPARYDDNAYAISQGKVLFGAMNCAGCHSQGGGGIGPPLLDAGWIYGSEPRQIYQTILEGRVNGMPSFKGRLSDQQIWQIVAYVRSLSGLTENMATAARDDHMMVSPNLQLRDAERPRETATANRATRR
jgi:cytochrome c oxidase cbb3-type subunit 3